MNILVFDWLIRPSLFFFHSASNAFPDIGSVGLKKKKKAKKITRRLGIGGPQVPQDDVKS